MNWLIGEEIVYIVHQYGLIQYHIEVNLDISESHQ